MNQLFGLKPLSLMTTCPSNGDRMNIKNIPSHWEIKKMPCVVKWSSGGTPKATEKQYYENGTIPWLVIGDLNNGIVTRSESMITELGLSNSSAKLVPPGTLLVAMYGSIGKLGITGMECCTNQAIAFAKEMYGVTTKYMYYYLAMIKSDLISQGKGGTQKNISLTVLNSFYVVVPPIEEQERIVAKIEELFSELDNGVETLKKTKQQLAVYRQATLEKAFSICNRKIAIERVCEHVTDGDHMPPPKAPNGIPFIMISNIQNNKIDWSNTAFVGREYYDNIDKKRCPQLGDVLYTVTGSFGIPVLIDYDKEFCFQRHIALLKPNNTIDQKFLFYAMQTPHVYSQATKLSTGTAQKTVGLTVLRKMQIPFIDDIDVQRSIVSDVESKMSVCDDLEKTVDIALKQAEAMRQSILKKAFEGSL